MIDLQKAGITVPIMLTADEIHKSFGISKRYTYYLAKSGKVKAIKAGNRFLLNAQSVSDFLNNHTLTDEQPEQVSGIRSIGIK